MKDLSRNHFDGCRYFNPWNRRKSSWLDVLKWKFNASRGSWPKTVNNSFSDVPPSHVQHEKIRVSFVGHSTALIQTQGFNILTDPIWSQKIGPRLGIKLKRVVPPGISFEDLPKIDLILLSHNHYDHLDQVTLKRLWKRDNPHVITPLGNERVLRRIDSHMSVTTLDWGQSQRVNAKLTVHLEPAQHWSARGLWDIDKALWGSFVLEMPNHNIYFAGDSGYNQTLYQRIKEKYGHFRFALLPIGAYEPQWFMHYAHMNPEEATQAFLDLNPSYAMAIHFGTFRLSDEGYCDPEKALEEAKQKHKIPNEAFRALKIGEYWDIPGII